MLLILAFHQRKAQNQEQLFQIAFVKPRTGKILQKKIYWI